MNKKIMIFLMTAILINMSCKDNPVKPENHNPIILSLTAFPDTIGIMDSAIVVCNAYDPDGDTLVYDWITDGRLKIKGALDFEHFLYHTHESSRIVYPTQSANITTDTAWVQCFVRDVKGGGDAKLILFTVKRNTEGDLTKGKIIRN